MNASDCLQESPEKKAEWLTWVTVAFPVGARVRIVDSDDASLGYVGLVGTVESHDVGDVGDWPLVGVKLDDGRRDGFYADGEDREIVPV